VAEGRSDFTREEIASAAAGFVGTFLQEPPVFSSKKIEGRRASDLARAGRNVELAPASVTVHSLWVGEPDATGRFTMKVRCSTGTYVRALARDLGLKLGTVAMLEKLERTSNGRFKASEGLQVRGLDLSRDLLPMRESLYFLEEAFLRPEALKKVKNGVPLTEADLISGNLKSGVFRLIFNELLLSVIERKDGRFLYLDNFSADI
jgi:tRNA pseudouridine55 synthase